MAEKDRKKVDDKIMKIWVQYKKNSTDQLRNVLMERYLTVVKYNAERIYAKLPDEVELDDLISAGVFGLSLIHISEPTRPY